MGWRIELVVISAARVWRVATVLLGLAWGWLLLDAVGDLVRQPAFDGVLRLVIEGVAAVVTTAAAWRRAQPGRGPRG